MMETFSPAGCTFDFRGPCPRIGQALFACFETCARPFETDLHGWLGAVEMCSFAVDYDSQPLPNC